MCMERNKKILFIAWDSPLVTYLEGLFIPIFEQLNARYGYEFHIIQFSWASDDRIRHLTEFCRKKNIVYTHFKIILKPIAPIGKYLTLFRGVRFVNRYLKEN